MKTILIPTDFSSNANNALNYAIELCKKDPAKLLIVNAYKADLEGHKDSSIAIPEGAPFKPIKRSPMQRLITIATFAF
ncbi:MAG: universal stress protein [Sphingobacteriaceae bacterium]|nr:universal stress protein [Sphingobacteriaceae bacterium]